MTQIDGLYGLRPHPDHVAEVTVPPYDVIKPGTKLEHLLRSNVDSLFHVTLGENPAKALTDLQKRERIISDEEPSFYIYEQNYTDNNGKKLQRTGFFAACAVSDYSEHQVIRHEKTFDEKVKGRIELTNKIGHSIGPIFLLTKSSIGPVLDQIKNSNDALYDFTTDFDGHGDLDGIHNRIFRVPVDSTHGKSLQALISERALYIADGHHRYHAALKNNQSHALTYIVEDAKILAYNRVCTGLKTFNEIKEQLDLVQVDDLHTPEKNSFCIYSADGCYTLKAKDVPADVVGCLDCSILEKELYPLLGLSHEMVVDPKHFDYYAESELDKMKACVDAGSYDIAIALHPVSIDELMAVADAGLENSDVVMPEKSTFFAPKILTGVFVLKN